MMTTSLGTWELTHHPRFSVRVGNIIRSLSELVTESHLTVKRFDHITLVCSEMLKSVCGRSADLTDELQSASEHMWRPQHSQIRGRHDHTDSIYKETATLKSQWHGEIIIYISLRNGKYFNLIHIYIYTYTVCTVYIFKYCKKY